MMDRQLPIKGAMASCEASDNNPGHHFAGAGKMIELGKHPKASKPKQK